MVGIERSVVPAGRVDPEEPIQPTEAGRGVEAESQGADSSKEADRSGPATERTHCDDGEQDGEYCADESIAAADVAVEVHTQVRGLDWLVPSARRRNA
jgi:hypothetical protein